MKRKIKEELKKEHEREEEKEERGELGKRNECEAEDKKQKREKS